MFKGSIGLRIPIIVRVVMIWYKVLFILIVSFDVLVSRKKVFLESIHRIETHLDVVVDVIDINISVSFEFCLDEDFMEVW